MPRTFDLLVADSHRAWTAQEIAEELGMSESEVTWDLEEAHAGGIARWVMHDADVLWFAADGGGAVSLGDAYEKISMSTGLPFVDLQELAELAGLSASELHAELAKLERSGGARFSGTNLAVVPPDRKRFAYTMRSGERVMLVQVVNRRRF